MAAPDYIHGHGFARMVTVTPPTPERGVEFREPGAILLVACYELGHQPLGVAWPKAFLERAGYAAETLDLTVDPLDEGKVRPARLVAVAVAVHTAVRNGVAVAARVRL